jgi:hypothetical protein
MKVLRRCCQECGAAKNQAVERLAAANAEYPTSQLINFHYLMRGYYMKISVQAQQYTWQ